MQNERFDPQRTALVYFDTLKTYAYESDMKTVAPHARFQVDALASLNQLARKAGIPVFYARADHRPDGKDAASGLTDLQLVSRSGGGSGQQHVWGTEAANIIDEIAPQPGDYQIFKHRWSAFFQTELELSLRSRGIDTILLAGGSTEVGIGSTAYEGRDLDFNVVIVRETMHSGRGPWVSDYFVNEIAPGISRVRSLQQVADALGAGAVSAPKGEAPHEATGPAPIVPTVDDPRLDPKETGVLIFDMLHGGNYDHQTRKLKPESRAYIEAGARMIEAARKLGMPIFYTKPIHREDGADWCSALTDRVGRPNVERFGKTRINPGSFAGSWEADVVEEVAPQPGDYIIKKHRYNAFLGTPLELSMHRAGVRNVILAGAAINAGVASTAYGARDRDFNLITLRDACRAGDPAITAYFMDHVFPRMGRVRTVDQTIALLG
jgi:nicotinamidase-related amidase